MIKTILNAVALKTATFTAAATDIITSASHGLSNGDAVVLTTTDTLPAGLSTETIYYVMAVTANTFKLSTDKPDGVNDNVTVDITDTGTGTHTYTIASVGMPIHVGDYRHKNIVLATNGMGAGDTITVKPQVSIEENLPDFHKSKDIDNLWDYAQNITLEDGSSVDGDDGVQFADSDDVIIFALNVDGVKWLNLEITAQSDVANTTVTGKAMLSGKHSNPA